MFNILRTQQPLTSSKSVLQFLFFAERGKDDHDQSKGVDESRELADQRILALERRLEHGCRNQDADSRQDSTPVETDTGPGRANPGRKQLGQA